MNRPMAAWLIVLALALSRMLSTAAEAKPETLARTAAEKWLTLVDAGKYDESWAEMSAPFKNEVSKRKWKNTIGTVRKPLGKVSARKLKFAEYAKELPGAPEGEHVVVQFETTFASKAGATEKITLMLGQDLIWRVSSYAIK